MNLGWNFRGGLDRLPSVLEQLVARINTIWGKEHNPATGGHTDIHADSITVGGEPIDTEFIAYTNVANVFTEPQRIDNTGEDALELNEPAQPVDGRLFRIIAAGQLLHLQAINDAKTIAHGYIAITRTGDLIATRNIYERSRAVAMGDWIAVPFNAANFSGVGGMTWTVAAGNVATNAYTLVGNTMTWTVYVTSTTIGGVASASLVVTLPAGFLCQQYDVAAAKFFEPALGWMMGEVSSVAPGDSRVSIQKPDHSAWALGPSHVRFTITMRIA